VGTQPLFSEFWLRKFVARKEVVTPSRTAIYRQPFVLDGFSASLGDWAAQFAGESGKSLSEKPEGFRKLSVPLTLVWGQQDTITPLPQAQTCSGWSPDQGCWSCPASGIFRKSRTLLLFNGRMAEALRLP
jgi:pimeloyl-ACP methyl ester carboxylesterase